MDNIRFANKEHEAFYFEMLAATRNNDVFHKAFFTQWESVRKREAISAPL